MSAFDPLDMGRRLVAMRRRRLARDEDEQNALFAARASQEYWNAARSNANASTPGATSDAPRALPFVGPGAPAPADRSSLAEEEWNFSRAGNASGGAGKAAAGANAAPARPEKRAASSSPGGGAAVSRSPGAVKAGLVTGSQAAVVKLASYGAGSVRAGALLNYQSHKGELALEREDGTLVFGKQAVGDLAAQWRDEADGREPSNDVLSFALTFSETATPEHVRDALGDALNGHSFAWRMEETQVHVVIVAASAERGARRQRQAGADLPQRKIARPASRQDRQRPECRNEPERAAVGAWRRRGDNGTRQSDKRRTNRRRDLRRTRYRRGGGPAVSSAHPCRNRYQGEGV